MFDKLVGNEEIKKLLKEALETNNVSHSYMFSGISGIGKKLFAIEFAKEIMCLENHECNNTCDSCIKFNAESNPDFSIVIPDGNSIKVNQIRSLQEDIAKKPIISNKKVYIIENADLMSEESQNCLLKTLEEPPEYANIILIVSNESRMLPTIKSRCVILKFSKINNQDLLKSASNLTEEQVELLDGSFEKLPELEAKTEEYESVKRIVDTLKNKELVDVLNNSDVLYNGKDVIGELLDFLNIVFMKNGLIEPIEIVEKTKTKLKYNNNYEMCIDNLLMKCYKAIHKI